LNGPRPPTRPGRAERPGRKELESGRPSVARMERTGPSLGELLVDVWRQAIAEGRTEFLVGSKRCTVGRTRAQGLRTVTFAHGDVVLEGIEQNPEKTSRWAQLAREGKRIMQFRCGRRYVANVCEGTLLRYPAWKGLGLPD